MLALALLLSCGKKEEPKTAAPPASASAPATQNAPAASTPAATSQEAPATSPVQTQAAAEQAQPPTALAPEGSPGSCCSVVPNPTMKGRLGRLVVTYPEGTNAEREIFW